jgi:hypothetical protein
MFVGRRCFDAIREREYFETITPLSETLIGRRVYKHSTNQWLIALRYLATRPALKRLGRSAPRQDASGRGAK